MLRLYEIPEAYRALDAAIDDGGELTPEIEAAFDALATDLVKHVDSLGCLIKEWNAEEDAFREEARRMTTRAAALAKKQERIRDRVLAALVAAKVDKVKGARFTARRATASKPTITWSDPDAPIPRAFLKAQPAELDGRLAQEAHKAGTLPAGFAVVFKEYPEIR